MRLFFTILFVAFSSFLRAQTLGGAAAYNFLKFPYAPALTAAGGVNISHAAPDVALALNNLALLNPILHAQLGLNFTQLPAGIKAYNLAGAYHDAPHNTTFGAQVIFLNYGSLQGTDAAGNLLGQFRATDYLVQLSAGRTYLDKWHYGASVKFIHSSYQPYTSAALAVDVGLHYADTAMGIHIAVLAKNMGAQVKKYADSAEDLPFDLQVGVTKKLAKAPVAFSLTLQQVHRFDLLYHDPVFAGETNSTRSTSFFNKAAQHLVFATHIYISNQLEATLGYNHLRHSELSLGTAANGLSGFSAGIAARFEKLHISYARSTYQRGIAFNQFGLNLMFQKLFGAGNF